MSTSPTGSAADLELHKDFAWSDQARLVDESGQIAGLHSMGFSERDRLELVKCAAMPERPLDGKRITDCFSGLRTRDSATKAGLRREGFSSRVARTNSAPSNAWVLRKARSQRES